MGRKSKFSMLYQHVIHALASCGKTDKQIIDYIKEDPSLDNVSITTLNNWKNQFPEFFDTLKDHKAKSDEKVERSLYELATGFKTTVEKWENVSTLNVLTKTFEDKLVLKERTIKDNPPSPVSCFFWLTNRKKEVWRNKVEHKHSGKVESVVTDFKVDAKDLTKDQLADRIKYLVEDHGNKNE